MESKFLSVEEVAGILGVDYQLIYRLVRAGELPAVRVGRVYRIDRSDLDAFVAARKTGRGGVCSACGKRYESAMSLKESCEKCGEVICVDCWTRRGTHKCGKC